MTPPASLAERNPSAPPVVGARTASAGRWSPVPRFVADDRGATMVEYGMMVALIALLVMGVLFTIGGTISTRLTQIATCVTTSTC